MALLSESASFVVALVLSVLTFSGMQMARLQLASSQPMTLLGGFLGSVLFVFLLTAVGNLERMLFGKHFQTKVGEALACLITATFATGSVHRVSATSCILFSGLMLYSMYQISSQVYGHHAPSTAGQTLAADKTKKKK